MCCFEKELKVSSQELSKKFLERKEKANTIIRKGLAAPHIVIEGKNILVSQPKPADMDKSPYGELCRKFNVNIDFHKFITIEGISAQEFRKAKRSF